MLCRAIGNSVIKASHAWIGLIRSGNGFAWVDGTAGNNLPWASGEPNAAHEKCVEMKDRPRNLEFNDAGCHTQRPALCEIKL